MLRRRQRSSGQPASAGTPRAACCARARARVLYARACAFASDIARMRVLALVCVCACVRAWQRDGHVSSYSVHQSILPAIHAQSVMKLERGRAFGRGSLRESKRERKA